MRLDFCKLPHNTQFTHTFEKMGFFGPVYRENNAKKHVIEKRNEIY